MIYRMSAALLSLAGLFISGYLYLYKIGRIGSLACGTGGCETVQLSSWSRFAGLEVSLIGVLGYAGLLALSLASLQTGEARPWLVRAMLSPPASGVRLYPVPHLSGAVRHPRHLPLVRRLRRDHPGDLLAWHCSTSGCSRGPGCSSMSVDPKASPTGQTSRHPGARRLGVVYGDIGTSPLYALKECFIGPHGVPVTKPNVLGRAVADLLVAELRRHVQVSQSS